MIVTNRIDGPGVSQTAQAGRTQGNSAPSGARADAAPTAVRGADQANFTRDGLQMQQLAEQVSAAGGAHVR